MLFTDIERLSHYQGQLFFGINGLNILTIILTFLFLSHLMLFFILTALNLSVTLKQKDSVPQSLKNHIPMKIWNQGVKYSFTKNIQRLFSHVTIISAMAIMAVTSLPGKLHNEVMALPFSEYLKGSLYLILMYLLLFLIQVPFSIINTFYTERKFGFNNTKWTTFLSDSMKSALLSGAFITVMYSGCLFIFRAFPESWWIYSWFIYTAISILFIALDPVLISPLFNKFKPLEEGPYKDKVRELTAKCHFPNQGIFVMDGSKRSFHANAYLSGFGRFRRIVFFDTLIDLLTPDEVAAILAHEIGHSKYGHIITRIIFNILSSLVFFFICGKIILNTDIFSIMDFQTISMEGLAIIAYFITYSLSLFLKPFVTSFSRKCEKQADNYVLTIPGNDKHFISSLIKLSLSNLSFCQPHPLFSFFFSTHPPLLQRIRNLNNH